MGSRFMHLLVADHVASTLHIKDRGRMLLGAIAPDALQEKSIAHFPAELYPHLLTRPVDYGQFILKYLRRLSDAFLLGYLTHLVTDDIWTMKRDFGGLKVRMIEHPELREFHYHDFWLLNAKLDDFYKPEGLQDALRDAGEVPFMNEIDADSVLAYKEVALSDFDYPPENISQPLGLFTMEETLNYVERCKSKSLDLVRMVYEMTYRI